MRSGALIVSIVITLTGCAGQQKVWVKDGATQDQFQRDHMNCRQYGMQSAMANGLAGNMFVEVWIQDETSTCLRNLGYRLQVVQKSPPVSPTAPHATTAAMRSPETTPDRNDVWLECFRATDDKASLDQCMKEKGFE